MSLQEEEAGHFQIYTVTKPKTPFRSHSQWNLLKVWPRCHLYCLPVSPFLDSQRALHKMIRRKHRAFLSAERITMVPRILASLMRQLPLSFHLGFMAVSHSTGPSNHFLADAFQERSKLRNRHPRTSLWNKKPVLPLADEEKQCWIFPEEDVLQFCQRSVACPLPTIHC